MYPSLACSKRKACFKPPPTPAFLLQNKRFFCITAMAEHAYPFLWHKKSTCPHQYIFGRVLAVFVKMRPNIVAFASYTHRIVSLYFIYRKGGTRFTSITQRLPSVYINWFYNAYYAHRIFRQERFYPQKSPPLFSIIIVPIAKDNQTCKIVWYI